MKRLSVNEGKEAKKTTETMTAEMRRVRKGEAHSNDGVTAEGTDSRCHSIGQKQLPRSSYSFKGNVIFLVSVGDMPTMTRAAGDLCRFICIETK